MRLHIIVNNSMLCDNKLICNSREELYRFLPKHAIAAELGVHAGENAYKLYELTNPKYLYLVDIWNWEAKAHELWWYDESGSVAHQKAINRFEPFSNVEIAKVYSYDFLARLPDEHLDWVYLDTSHLYEDTFKELELLRIKVKPGGLIAGHDYCEEEWGIPVKTAVNQFCATHQWRIVAMTTENVASFVIRDAAYPRIWV